MFTGRLRAFVLWTGDLLKNVKEAREEPWELLGRSPGKVLDRLESLIASLRLLAIEAGTQGNNLMQWRSIARNAVPDDALRSVNMAVERQQQASSMSYLQGVEAELRRQAIELELHTHPDWETPLPWPNRDFLAIADISSPSDWSAWIEAHAAPVQAAIGEGRQVWFIPRIDHLALSYLTIKGRYSLFGKRQQISTCYPFNFHTTLIPSSPTRGIKYGHAAANRLLATTT